MDKFLKPVQVRWSDLDPNFHVRHSVYYDWGAFCRINFMEQLGLTSSAMATLKIGPILFREEAIFRKEIHSADQVTIDLKLNKAKSDYSRWSIQHQLVKNGEVLAAVINVDGAWLDLTTRKLGVPPAEAAAVFSQMPVGESFEWINGVKP